MPDANDLPWKAERQDTLQQEAISDLPPTAREIGRRGLSFQWPLAAGAL